MRTHSKLAVLLHADVVGSTALVQKDERIAHDRIRDAFRQFSKEITRHGGTAHEIRGDALVAEFSKASDAVSAAVAFQAAHAEHLKGVLDAIRPEMRVGIAMGEVVVADGTITGEGVVLAQRLEQLAGPGGVCIQGAAYETIPKRLAFRFESLGERALKGFDEPVRAYAVHVRTDDPAPQSSPATGTSAPIPEPPGRPSIAVLPFTNISGDAEQDYFSDGIAEDILTDLSKVSGLFVIARNSSFAYRERPVDVPRMARELGVRYVLEGSVRRSGDRLRINAQLLEAASSSHLWAERYDGDLHDVFALQDRITENVVAALAVTLTRAEQKRALGKPTQNLQAYDYVLRGNAHHHQMTKESNATAREMFERAIALDPEYAAAHSGLAWVLVHDSNQGWSPDPQGALEAARTHAERAVALDDSLAQAHLALGDVYCWVKHHEQAIAAGRRAVALDPSYADGHMALGYFLVTAGYAEEALIAAEKALRFNPVHANRIYFTVLSHCYFQLDRLDEAVAAGEEALARAPNHKSAHLLLAAALAKAGRLDEAREHAREVVRLDPAFSLQRFAQVVPWRRGTFDGRLEGMRMAGLPE